METQILQINSGESKTAYTLTITNVSGGHESNNENNIDSSFVVINLKTNDNELEGMSTYVTISPIIFDGYAITVEEISRNAESITVTVSKI